MFAANVALEAPHLHHPEDQVALLVARAQAGDQAAFADLYRGHHRKVFALCVRLSGDRSLAEELTQETFVRAWQQLRGFRGESQLSTWLHRVAVNVVLGWQRKHRIWLERRMPEDEIPDHAVHESPGQARDLETAIAALPDRARQVFVLVDVEGHTHEETAALLGVAVGTSKAQLFRARQLLRGMLS